MSNTENPFTGGDLIPGAQSFEDPAGKLHELSLGLAEELKGMGMCESLMIAEENSDAVVLTIGAPQSFFDSKQYPSHKASMLLADFERSCYYVGGRSVIVRIASPKRFSQACERAEEEEIRHVLYVLDQPQLETPSTNKE